LQPSESVASQLQNLESQLFGPFTATPIQGANGRAVWSQLCSANSAVPGFPRNPGEGFICYIIRMMSTLLAQFNTVQYSNRFLLPMAYSIPQLQAVPTVNTIPFGAIVSVIGAINPGEESRYQLQAGSLPSTPPAYFPPNDNPNAHWMLVA